jgi:hypothetical protein
MSILGKSLRIAAVALLTCMSVAVVAAKDRAWQLGRVLDSALSRQIVTLGSVTNTSGTTTASGVAVGNTAGTATTVGNTTTLQGTTAINGSATASSQSTSYTAIQRAAVQNNELLIVTDRYLYVIEDSRSYMPGRPLMNAINNRHHGCRYIVGEDIKYAQEKGYLWILDPDGRECKVPIVRQQAK